MAQAEIVISEVGQQIVASPNQAMAALGIGRAKLYELINAGELESYSEGASRKITWRSIRARVERGIAAEAEKRQRRSA